MMEALCILGILLAVALSGFFSGSETGLYCMNRLRLRLDVDQGSLPAARLDRLVGDEQSALSTLLVGTNLSNYLATVFVAYLLTQSAGLEPGVSEIYTTMIVTPVVFVFGEVVPKNLFQRNADRLMRLGSRLFGLFAILLRLPVMVLNLVSRPILALVCPAGFTRSGDPRRRIALLLQDAIAAEDSPDEHAEFVDRVLLLSSVTLHQVMVPRNRVLAMRADADRAEGLSLIRKHPYSRFPVFDSNPRRIVGYVQADTLLADEQWVHVREHLRRVISIPAHDSVASAIVRLQAARETMAIVVDRGGYLLGLVTLKDLLEELIGELPEW